MIWAYDEPMQKGLSFAYFMCAHMVIIQFICAMTAAFQAEMSLGLERLTLVERAASWMCKMQGGAVTGGAG